MALRKTINVTNRQTGEVLIKSVKWCAGRWCKFVGFQFRRNLHDGEALILVHDQDTTRGSSIHMFFVFTSLAVVWINDQGRVTHKELARAWRPYYASPVPARYVLESTADFFERVSPGDDLDFTSL